MNPWEKDWSQVDSKPWEQDWAETSQATAVAEPPATPEKPLQVWNTDFLQALENRGRNRFLKEVDQKRFDSAKIGDELETTESFLRKKLKIKKVSNTGFTSPDMEKSSVLETAAMSAVSGIPGSAAFMSGAGATAAMVPIPNPWVKAGAGLVGGLAASIGTQYAEKKALEKFAPDVLHDIEASQQQNPKSGMVGHLLTSGFTLGGVGGGLAKNVAVSGFSGTLGAGFQAMAEPDLGAEGALGRVGLATAIGAFGNKETKLGEAAFKAGGGMAGGISGMFKPKPSILPSIEKAMGQNTPLGAQNAANEIGAAPQAVKAPKSLGGFSEVAPAPSQALSQFTPQPLLTPKGNISKKKGKFTLGEVTEEAPQEIHDAVRKAVSVFEEVPPVYTHPPEAKLTPLQGGKLETLTRPRMEFEEPGAMTMPPAEASAITMDVEGRTLEQLRQSRLAAEKLAADLGGQEAAQTTRAGGFTASLAGDLEAGLKANQLGGPETVRLIDATGKRLHDLDSARGAAQKERERLGMPQLSDEASLTVKRKGLDENGVPVAKPNQGLPEGRNPEAGVVYNPFAQRIPNSKIGQINKISFTRNRDGTYSIYATTNSGRGNKFYKAKNEIINEQDLPKSDLDDVIGKDMSDRIEKEANRLLVESGGKMELLEEGVVSGNIDGLVSADFPTHIGNQSGKIPMSVLMNMSSMTAGALIGYQKGDTKEEKLQNAFLGALLASGATISAQAMARYGKGAKSLKNEVEALKKAKEGQAKEATVLQEKGNYTLGEAVTGDWPVFHPEDTAGIVSNAIDEGFKAYVPSRLGASSVGQALEHVGTITDNIRRVHPAVAGAVRNMVQRENGIGNMFHSEVMPGLSALRKFVGNKDFDQIYRLLRNGKEAHVLAALDETPDGKVVADGLRNGWIAKRGEALEAWRRVRPDQVGEIENYWPLVVSDSRGLRKALEVEDASAMRDALEAARLKKANALEDPNAQLTPEEEGAALANLIEGSRKFPGTPGFIKERALHQIDKDWVKFFEPGDVSMDRYGASISHDIAIREALGRVDTNAKDPWVGQGESGGPLGALLAKLIGEKKIGTDGEEIIRQNINAYINRPTSSTVFQSFAHKVGMIQTVANLGQFTSMIPQLADVFLAAATRDPASAFKGFAKSLFKVKDRRKLEDIGIREGSPETQEYARNGAFGAKVTNFVLKPFFNWSDRVGKEGFMNATQLWAEKNARKIGQESSMPDIGKFNFNLAGNKTKAMFGDNEWQAMVKEMKGGNWLSPELKKFMFNELSDHQAISRSELPLGLLKASPLGRIPWRLMSFTLRQIGLARGNIYDAARQGRKMDAAIWGAHYVAWMIVGGSMVQYARDVASGRKASDPTDYAFGSLLQLTGVGKVAIGQMTRGDVTDAFADRLAPGLWGPVRDFGHDVAATRDVLMGNKDISQVESELVKRVPWGGKLYYDNMGAGKTRADKKERERGDSPSLFEQVEKAVIGAPSRRR